ncbi:MAG: tetratricopeptide repeat protein [Flavobacteriia bacterium]|nr:tetratricopeptide repeat protein [Flavobacteriia bacterium]OJX37623.1 MAG: hypothetical protein BGO87_11150 [Flavobacteriia bacterium 40-80]
MRSIFVGFLLLFSFYGFVLSEGLPNDYTKRVRNLKFIRDFDLRKVNIDYEYVKACAVKYNRQSDLAEIYRYYGDFFSLIGESKKAKIYFDSSLNLAKSIGAESIELTTRLHKNYLLFGQQNDKKILEELNFILNEAIKKDFKINQIETYNAFGIFYDSKGQQVESFKNYSKGLSIARKTGHKYHISYLQNNIGLIMLGNGKWESAIGHFEEAYRLTESYHYRLRGSILNNLGYVNVELGRFEKAEKYFQEIIKMNRKSPYKQNLIAGLLNIAIIREKQKKYKEALKYIDSVYFFSHDSPTIFQTEIEELKALCYEGVGDLKKMKHHIDLYNLHLERNDIPPTSSLYDLYASYFEKNGLKDSAIFYYKKYIALTDSINKENVQVKIAEIEAINNNEKLELSLEKTKIEKKLLTDKYELNKSRTLAIYVIVVFFMIIVVLIVYLVYSNKLKKKQQEFSNQLLDSIDQERVRIGADLHDDIGQTLSIMKTKFDLLSKDKTLDNASLNEDFSHLIQKTRTLSHKLYPSSLSNLGLKRSLISLLDNVSRHTPLVCTQEIDDEADNFLDAQQQFNIYRIIQENINNTLKHSEATALKVIIRISEEYVKVKYMDNGKGIVERRANDAGIGLKIIQERLKLLNSKSIVETNTNQGFKMVFKIKIL